MSGATDRMGRQSAFGGRIGFGSRPALLVVDLIRGFTDPELPLGSALDAEVARTDELLHVAHDQRLPVFFTAVAYESPDMADAGVWWRKQDGLRSLRAGSPAVALDRRLSTRAGDTLILKKFASAFFGTDLLTRLISQRVDTVVVTGCTTSGCVRASAVDAVQYGFRPIVVEDAVGDRWPEAHAQSLLDLDQKYCDVMSAADVRSRLRGLRPSL
ncbi:MAG: isochorismatase family protein [Candidatus Dormibacteria bacterium]